MITRFYLISTIGAILLPMVAADLRAEISISATGGTNRGEHILEAGSRLPGLFSADGRGRGSRITYRRDFNQGGFELYRAAGAWRYGVSFSTTGWYVNSGGTRDEDFYMTIASGAQEAGYNHINNNFYDSAHTFTGTRNFADAEARSTVSDYSVLAPVRYYFEPREYQSGFFLLGAARYSYFDFFVFDVIQFVDTDPIFIAPVGEGLRFANSTLEIHGGGGYSRYFENGIGLELSAYGLGGTNRARDFHIQRALNFVVFEAYGTGFGYNLSVLYRLGNSMQFRAGIYGHRYYSRGLMKTTGGYATEDVLSTFGGPFSVWINTKEAGADVGIAYIF